ncbi:hypothetical protein N7528_003702 [Penicillium herquei]|nr:hypothetical protein N7528_003702 [Penicillium herquei]
MLILRVPVLGVATLIAGWVPMVTTLGTTGSGTFEQALGDPVVKEGRRAVAGDEIQQLLFGHPSVGIVAVSAGGGTEALSVLVGHKCEK